MNKYFGFTILGVLAFYMTACQTKKAENLASNNTKDQIKLSDSEYYINSSFDTIYKVVLTDNEWKKKLNQQEYDVLRKKGTEYAFSGDLLKNKKEGVYTCRGCGLSLFSSKTKFESGTGWPSYFDVIDPKNIHTETDHIVGYPRTELTCARCDGHLGHVFNDGPKPTGLRYCINSASLDFVDEKQKK